MGANDLNAEVDLDTWGNAEEVKMPAKLPEVALWRVMVMPVVPRKMSRGEHGTRIHIPDQARDNDRALNYIGRIVGIGPLAGKKEDFKNPDLGRTQNGRNKRAEPVDSPVYLWDFKLGDWIIYGRYAGQRMEYEGVRFLIVNDDEILAKVPGPDGFRMYV